MRETFSSHVEPIDCWHCASSIQPWCSSESELITHINDPGVRKLCPSGRCKTEITGGNVKIIFCLLQKVRIVNMKVFDFHDLYLESCSAQRYILIIHTFQIILPIFITKLNIICTT